MGSCFTENISAKMINAGFQTMVNPFGIVYNPLSLGKQIERLFDRKAYTSSDIFSDKTLYHSFSHHSRFSGTNPKLVLENINRTIREASDFLQKVPTLILTFGTAFVYRLKASGEIVSNCHKLPDAVFTHHRAGIPEIVSEWNRLISLLKTNNPALKIIFTVSPIRHWKNGANENQLSKATLLLSIHELVNTHQDCYYFPSYEMMLDDLRDYRFYADDMIHPSPKAIDYIWEKFSETFFDKKTIEAAKNFENAKKALNHRPLHPTMEPDVPDELD
ncbi:hypothetical protein FACS1894123_11390 [Bacteroidia bacterium]|nr:hypothetical protein FACS1894123_11390 [Bacteroidia bacterium]